MLSRVPISPDDVKFGGKLVDKLVLPLGASLNCYVYEIYTRDRTGRCEFE